MGGNEFSPALPLRPGDRRRRRLLTDGGRRRTAACAGRTEGDRLAYTSTRRNGTRQRHLRHGPARPEDATACVLQVRRRRLVARSTGRPTTRSCWWRRASRSTRATSGWSTWPAEQKTLLTPEGAARPVAYAARVFAADGKGVYVTTDKDSEFQRLACIDLATRRRTLPEPRTSTGTSTSFDLSPDGATIAFVTNEDGAERAAPARHRERQGEAGARSCRLGHRGHRRIEWHQQRPRPGLHARRRRARRRRLLARRDDGQGRALDRERDGRPRRGRASPSRSSCAGRASTAGRSRASSTSRPRASPASGRSIINIHGGPEGQSRPGFLGRNNYYLNELGVALIYPNVRGSTGFGKTFLKLDNGVKREDSVKDIGALLDWIADAARTSTPTRVHGHRRQLRRLHDAGRRPRTTTTASAARSTSSASRTSSPSSSTPRPTAATCAASSTATSATRRCASSSSRSRRCTNADKITKPLFVVAGQERPARALHGGEQMVATVQEERHAGLVPDGQGRGPRLRQEEEPGLPVLRHRRLRAGVPAPVVRRPPAGRRRAETTP